jgi:hypothetical protein
MTTPEGHLNANESVRTSHTGNGNTSPYTTTPEGHLNDNSSVRRCQTGNSNIPNKPSTAVNTEQSNAMRKRVRYKQRAKHSTLWVVKEERFRCMAESYILSNPVSNSAPTSQSTAAVTPLSLSSIRRESMRSIQWHTKVLNICCTYTREAAYAQFCIIIKSTTCGGYSTKFTGKISTGRV